MFFNNKANRRDSRFAAPPVISVIRAYVHEFRDKNFLFPQQGYSLAGTPTKLTFYFGKRFSRPCAQIFYHPVRRARRESNGEGRMLQNVNSCFVGSCTGFGLSLPSAIGRLITTSFTFGRQISKLSGLLLFITSLVGISVLFISISSGNTL